MIHRTWSCRRCNSNLKKITWVQTPETPSNWMQSSTWSVKTATKLSSYRMLTNIQTYVLKEINSNQRGFFKRRTMKTKFKISTLKSCKCKKQSRRDWCRSISNMKRISWRSRWMTVFPLIITRGILCHRALSLKTSISMTQYTLTAAELINRLNRTTLLRCLEGLISKGKGHCLI